MKTYEEVRSWLFEQLPYYQKQGSIAYKPDLKKMLVFLSYLGNPHKGFSSIHVAGTNGKGSTSHMITSVLMEAGYKVGLYTSPHLKDFTERIRINGIEMDSKYVVDSIEKKWLFKWEKIKFKNKKNVDLWLEFLPLQNKHNIQFKWIKGHNDHPQNERCDKLAVGASKKENLFEDKGYNTNSNTLF